MRRYLYLSTAVAGVMMTAGAGTSLAQCVTTQNCAELGYTETSCPDGTGIKCPFGDTFACTGGSCANDCAELGFTYPCTGANETSGSGKSCDGKYIACTCASGYEWKDGACKERQPDYAGCAIGTLFYSDNTCSSNKVSGKTLLGVVIMEKTSSANGWIMTINPIQTGIAWSNQTVDIPEINQDATPSDTQASCTNTDVIIAYGNSSTYPAAWAAKNYKPIGTPSGKSWCLPSAGLLNDALNNQTNLNKIENGIVTAGGTRLGHGGAPNYSVEDVWSSSGYSYSSAWCCRITYDSSVKMEYVYKYYDSDYLTLRPVMEF